MIGVTRAWKWAALLTVMLMSSGVAQKLNQSAAQTRHISINGVVLHPLIDSKSLPSGREGLPVWFLPRLGIQTRNDPQNLWLGYGTQSLRFAAGRWSGLPGAERLSAPERYGAAGSIHIPLDVLRLLGVPLSGNADTLDVTVRQSAREVPRMVTLPSVRAAQVAVSQNMVAKSPPRMVSIAPPQASVELESAPPSTSSNSPSGKTTPKAAPKGTTQISIQPNIKLGLSVRGTPVTPNATISVQPPVIPMPRPAPLPRNPSPTTPPVIVPVAPPATPTPRPSTSRPTSALPTVRPLLSLPPATSPAPQQPSTQQPSANVPLIGPRLTEIRSSLTPNRNVMVQRVVIDMTGPVQYTAQRSGGQLNLFLLGASAQPSNQKLDSGDNLSVQPAVNAQGRPGIAVRLLTTGAIGEVQTLQNPDRLVIDSAVSQHEDVPPPINEAALPDGVTLRKVGGLSLLSFDPQRFRPRVVSAVSGGAASVAELTRRVGGVAGVNGGYFDPPTNLSVDFVMVAGQMLNGSLERRATVGFDDQGRVVFGYPRPRYFAEGNSFGSVRVNTVSPRAQADLLNAFVGDGKTAVGSPALTTLLLSGGPSGGTVSRVVQGAVIPPVGVPALSFSAARFPQLPRTVGAALNLRLDYQIAGWDGIREGLAAGPLLLQGGRVVLNPTREAFKVYTSIWRATRQVAFAVYQGQPTIAFLESGTPESLAYALQRSGVSDALRLDSGSSATTYVAGGYLGNGGYLNTVWSRPVPNAIVFTPK